MKLRLEEPDKLVKSPGRMIMSQGLRQKGATPSTRSCKACKLWASNGTVCFVPGMLIREP